MPGSESEKTSLVLQSLKERQTALAIYATQFLKSELQLTEQKDSVDQNKVIDYSDLETQFDSPKLPNNWESFIIDFISKILSL